MKQPALSKPSKGKARQGKARQGKINILSKIAIAGQTFPFYTYLYKKNLDTLSTE
jgi:hypothetical protein